MCVNMRGPTKAAIATRHFLMHEYNVASQTNLTVIYVLHDGYFAQSIRQLFTMGSFMTVNL